MADIARRSLNKFTYAPVRPSDEDRRAGTILKTRRGLDKIAFASALRLTSEELQAVKAELGAHGSPEVIGALTAIYEASAAGGRARQAWKRLSVVPANALVGAGHALANHRRARRTELATRARALLDEHTAFVRKTLEAAAAPPNANVHVAAAAPAGAAARAVAPRTNPWRREATDDPRLSAASLRPSMSAALEWARVRQPERADALAGLARSVAGVHTEVAKLRPAFDADRFAGAVLEVIGEAADPPASDTTQDLTDGFAERMTIEPIGRLHLERIDMTPVGVMRGELVHAVGLAPSETVTVIHREWSSREVSFEKVVSEEFEQSTEEGVTENTELASAVETQQRHSSALNMQATASGSYGFASGSVSVGYNSTSDDQTAKRDSRNPSVSVTRKASARTRQEHKSTFTVKEQAGVEDQSVRTLTNSSPTDPLRIDFHQLVRDWKVDLYRYGLRLTYDVVVPAPGIDLLANVDELRRIENQLAQPFVFGVVPVDITRASWQQLAARYAADLDAPDPETIQMTKTFTYPTVDADNSLETRIDPIEFDVPAGYVVASGDFRALGTIHMPGYFEVVEDNPAPILALFASTGFSYVSGLELLQGRFGHVIVTMLGGRLGTGFVQATLGLAQTEEGWRAWQSHAWVVMRKAAEEQWQTYRQDLQQRRDKLTADLANWDPLTLRRMEREEVMKTTLKWIFGPAFDLMPSEIAGKFGGDPQGLATLEPAQLTVEQWAEVMGLGEFIKFLHEAIEWENVLYFVYPYFWDNPRNHALKRFLQHPDSIHQAFLRGGAARVVLTVRPGFEDSFTSLFESGAFDEPLGSDHPYMTIAQEIQAFASTHYPGIPAATDDDEADPEAIAKAEKGERIATWHEYTPISALDITANTPLAELK
jgi:hypothetical protein